MTKIEELILELELHNRTKPQRDEIEKNILKEEKERLKKVKMTKEEYKEYDVKNKEYIRTQIKEKITKFYETRSEIINNIKKLMIEQIATVAKETTGIYFYNLIHKMIAAYHDSQSSSDFFTELYEKMCTIYSILKEEKN